MFSPDVIDMVTKEMIKQIDNIVVLLNGFSAMFIGFFALTLAHYRFDAVMYGGIELWAGIVVMFAILTLVMLFEYSKIIKKLHKMVE